MRRADCVSPPVSLQIEPTTDCNLQCSICPRASFIPRRRNMSLKELKDIIAKLHPRSVELSGLGEPFMNPELTAMVVYLKQQGIYVSTTSNFLIGAGQAQEIVDSGLDLLKVSLDAPHEKAYKELRHNDGFIRIIEGIRALGEIKKTRGSRTPLIEIRMVITPNNLREIVDMVELASGLGIAFLSLQIFELTDTHGPQARFLSCMDHVLAIQCLKQAKLRARQLKLANNISRILERYPVHIRQYEASGMLKGPCLLPWFFVFINADGTVRPCCKFSYTASEADMGNIFNAPVNGIWRGEGFTGMRRSLIRGKRPYALCQRCVGIGYADLFEGVLKEIKS